MQLIVCWIVFPLLLAILAFGCGSLVTALAGSRPSVLAIPVGLALIIGVLDVAVRVGPLRPLALALVIALAVVGLALAWPLSRPPLWPTLSAVGVFAAVGAPIVMSGHATFTGFIKLDDTATFFALTDRVFGHGPTLTGLAPSSYEATLWFYFGSGYPLGSFLPIGLGHRLVGQDIAWLFAPYLAFTAAALALALEAIAAALVSVAWRRAVIAFVAAQAALLYGYAQWGGVKELVAAAFVAAFVAVCPLGERLLSLRAWIPAAVVAGAMVAAETVGGLVWLLPAAVGCGLPAVRSLGLRRPGSRALLPAALFVVALAISLTAGGFLEHNLNVLRSEQELGNLVTPLSGLQVLGIWPTGDFRYQPSHMTVTHVLVAVVAIAGGIGAAVALARRAWVIVMYLVAAGLGALVIGVLGSPWLGAKALATASPAFVFVALVGAAALAAGVAIPGGARRVEALVIAVAVGGGVLWSNVLAYHEVNLAPQGQLAELEHIAPRIAGRGPTLLTEYQPYGVRHFLRAADPESASELRRRVVPLRNGQPLQKGATADINQFSLQAVMAYRTLVLRRSPVASRPPAAYQQTYVGRYYEVWQRPASGWPAIIGDLPLGTGTGAVPDCQLLTRLAATAGVAMIVAAPAIDPAPASVGAATLRRTVWPRNGADPGQVLLDRGGDAAVTVSLPASRRYSVWVGGSGPRGALSASVDGIGIGSVRDQLQYAGQFVRIGARRLDAGVHRLRLHYGGDDWRPGSGGPPPLMGPLVIAADQAPPPLVRVAPRDAQTLCGRRLYWVEALAG